MEERELQQIVELVMAKLRREKSVGSGERRVASTDDETRIVSATSLSLPVDLASCIDHTLLKPEASEADIEKLCSEGIEHHFYSVCVDGSWAGSCVNALRGSGTKVVTVAGFPLGASTSRAKAAETAELAGLGVDEIDMVAPVGRILGRDWDYVEADIAAVVEAATGIPIKVILETALLSPALVVQASAIAMSAGASFVKTSTGFHPAGGASEEAVALMHAAVGDRLGVKASGGIRDYETTLRMIAAGATRIGTSSGVQIIGRTASKKQTYSS